MSSDSDKEEEEEEEERSSSYMFTAGRLDEETGVCEDKYDSVDSQCCKDDKKEVSGGRLPRRRWSRRIDTTDGVLMVKSMLDLRLLDLYCSDRQEEQQVMTHPIHVNPSHCSPSRHTQGVQAGLYRMNQEPGSTVSLQVTTAWVDDEAKTNQRPDFILLPNESPDRKDPVLYPDQWEDRVSLAGSEFQVKEACPAAAGGREDKPSPDSGCSLGFGSRLSSPDRPAGDDLEPTEPLSVDGNSSELEEEDEDERGAGGCIAEVEASHPVPQTPDQEAFLKEHFVMLAHLSASGSPTRVSHSSSESLSISSRFLSQNSTGSQAVVPLTSKGGGGVLKARPLVSEVQPLMEQNWSQDRKVSWNQDQISSLQDHTKPPQVGNQIQQGTDQHQSQVDEQEISQQTYRPSPLKRKVQTTVESRRNLGPTARAAASHLNSSGLRKTQSVHSLLTDTGDSSVSQSIPCPSREVLPQLLLPLPHPTTLPSSPRCPQLSTSMPSQRPSPATPRSPQQESAAVTSALVNTPSVSTAPRKSSSSNLAPSVLRPYMNPTASSMAKMSRSVSMGDGLNVLEPAEDAAVTSASHSVTPSGPDEVKETPPPPVAVVPSTAALAVRLNVAVIPVVASSSVSNQVVPAPRGIQARVPGSSRPLPNKPSLAASSPSSKTSAAQSSSSLPLPVSVSLLTPPRQAEDAQTPSGTSAEQRDDTDQPISMEICRTLTNELQSCFKRATHLYRKVSGSSPDDSTPDQRQMALVLSEAFRAMRVELESLPLAVPSVLGGVGEVKTAALLEEYSLLLLQAVHRRVNTSPH